MSLYILTYGKDREIPPLLVLSMTSPWHALHDKLVLLDCSHDSICDPKICKE